MENKYDVREKIINKNFTIFLELKKRKCFMQF